MKTHRKYRFSPLGLFIVSCLSLVLSAPAGAEVLVQCPGDLNGDAIPDIPDPEHPQMKCMHLGAGDGYVKMADGRVLYMFGFGNLTGVPTGMSMMQGMLGANAPGPTIVLDQGDEFFLSLTNVGMLVRPDLFDPHTVHFHGFPNASAIFDGMPDASISVNMGSTLTYYYNVVREGTYMYHCHVEATEHMQMGMLGQLYVRAAQNRLPDGTLLGSHIHSNPDWDSPSGDDPLVGDKYAYSDGDGSTIYDVEVALQLGGFDPAFHDASELVQPLPFALMQDRYPLINGRGYPDTIVPGGLDPLPEADGKVTQKVSALVQARVGDRILLRISDLNITQYHTLSTLGLVMTVVGKDARLLRGPTGENLFYQTRTLTLGGGESYDVIIDTEGVEPGTYLLYSGMLNLLSNDAEDFGGMMTEIIISE